VGQDGASSSGRTKDFILEDEEEKTDEIEHGNSDISDLSHLRRCRRQRFEGVTYNRPECYHQLEPHAAASSSKVRTAVVRNKTRQAEYQTFRTTPRGRDKIDEAVVFELKWTEDMKDTEKRNA
jgi:RNase P protein component